MNTWASLRNAVLSRRTDWRRVVQWPDHHQSIHESGRRMPECGGEPADNLEPARLPQPDRSRVRADDEVELHGAESTRACAGERVLAHRAAHAPAGRVRRGDVAAVRDVRAAALLVGAEIVRAGDLAAIERDKDLVLRSAPVG